MFLAHLQPLKIKLKDLVLDCFHVAHLRNDLAAEWMTRMIESMGVVVGLLGIDYWQMVTQVENETLECCKCQVASVEDRFFP